MKTIVIWSVSVAVILCMYFYNVKRSPLPRYTPTFLEPPKAEDEADWPGAYTANGNEAGDQKDRPLNSRAYENKVGNQTDRRVAYRTSENNIGDQAGRQYAYRASQNKIGNQTDRSVAYMASENEDGDEMDQPVTYRAYENKTIGCTVKLVESMKDTKKQMEQRNVCTRQLFDEYFLKTHQFHGEGIWYTSNSTKPDNAVQYIPSMCSFSQDNLRKVLPECAKRNKMRKILVTGDSNGHFFKEGILQVLTDVNYACDVKRSTVWKHENGSLQKDRSYLDVPGVDHNRINIPIFAFASMGWAYREYECQHLPTNDTENSFVVEFIHSGWLPDRQLHLTPAPTGKNNSPSAESKIEYLLRYYYPHLGFPDVWFLSLPFHIMCMDYSLEDLEKNITTVLGYMEKYLPKTVDIVFLSDATACTKYERFLKWLGNFQERWHMMIDEKIHHMNQVLFKMLVPQLTSHKNYHVFVDASRVACPVTCTWHGDGSHMLPTWYYKMAEYNLRLTCG